MGATRFAVFDGSSCDPVGTEMACEFDDANNSLSTTATLTGGTTYLIAFWTWYPTHPMYDPEISITPP